MSVDGFAFYEVKTKLTFLKSHSFDLTESSATRGAPRTFSDEPFLTLPLSLSKSQTKEDWHDS
jgi:hypothetical protein